MKTEQFDVLMVGAGPAGSFAAERLAKSGARVALFDGRPENENPARVRSRRGSGNQGDERKGAPLRQHVAALGVPHMGLSIWVVLDPSIALFAVTR